MDRTAHSRCHDVSISSHSTAGCIHTVVYNSYKQIFFSVALIFRRSVSTVDSAFGLTEKQRSAKEKEEQSIALVEIQRRDEHSFPALGVSYKTHSHWGAADDVLSGCKHPNC